MKRDQTGVIPDSYTDTIIDSCPVAQLTWAPALDAAPRPVTSPSTLRWTSSDIEGRSIMEWAAVEFTEALMFVSVFQRHLVGESEEEESEGLSWDKVKASFLDVA
jgi:hypothetical protein